MSSVLPVSGLSLAQAARDLWRRKISPVELVEECLRNVTERDKVVSAFATLTEEDARRAAQLAQKEMDAGQWRGPLHGIPLAVKDVIDVAGVPTFAQSRQLADYIPQEHATAVARLVSGGAVLMGKLTTHEFAFGLPPDVPPFRPAKNPWDTTRFAGGSSSGAAVGVACSMVLGALGSDTAGSIRSPAALCGMTGFKPSRDTIPRKGSFPLAPSLDALGVIALTAEDCALLYAGTSGDALLPANAHAGPPPLTSDLRGVRIGVARDFFSEACDTSSALSAAIDTSLMLFREAGCSVQDVTLPPIRTWNAAGMTLLLWEAYALHEPWLRNRLHLYGQSFADAVLLGATIEPGDYVNALQLQDALRAEFHEVMEPYDLLIAPIQAGEAPKREALSQWGFLTQPSYGIPFNMTDLPAISICCGFGVNHMPLAMQIVGKRGGEAQVLRAAHAYQMTTEWHECARAFDRGHGHDLP